MTASTATTTGDRGTTLDGGGTPAAGGSGGSGRAAIDPDRGLLSFIGTLPAEADAMSAEADRLTKIASHAAEEQPVSSAVAEQLATAAGLVKAAGIQIEAAHATAMREAEADRQRAEQPRTSVNAEKRADVTASERDGYTG